MMFKNHKTYVIIVILSTILSFSVGCSPGLADAGYITTDHGHEFHILSQSTTTGDIYYLTQDGNSLSIEVGDEIIKSSDFFMLYDSNNLKAYLFYDTYIILSTDNKNFQLVDKDFVFDRVPEIDQIIASCLLHSGGTLFMYYDVLDERQPESIEFIKEAYNCKDFKKLSEFGLPSEKGPRDTIMISLSHYIH